MGYTKKQQEYIDSVGGEAHHLAVAIIGELDQAERNQRVVTGLRDLRYGLFKDADSVNALLDELIEIMEGDPQNG